jgi:nucleoside-diphosphate-sugar epimerase
MTVVLGGSGDIGSVLVARLQENRARFLAPTSKQVDLTDTSSTKHFFSSLSEPYSLVFAAFLDRRQGDNERTFKLNSLMFENVINFAKPSSIAFLSSMDVYGKTPVLPITENSLTDGSSFYSQAKLLAESKLSQTFAEKTNFLILRLPGVYGGNGPRNAALDRILEKGIRERMINVGAGGSLLRDWIYADEVARFLFSWLTQPNSGTYNFATGESWTINRYISECVSEIGDIRHEIDAVDEIEKSNFGANHVFDCRNLYAAFNGWKFETRTLSLKKYTNWYHARISESRINLNK